MSKASNYFGSIGTNIITPDTVYTMDCPDGNLIEVAAGTGFDNEALFGVTVVVPSDGGYKVDSDLSHLFRSRSLADEYVTALMEGRRVIDFDQWELTGGE